MRLFKSMPTHLIPIHPNNATSKDWLVLLEAGTIVGPSPRKLRVARSTRERKVVKKRNMFLKVKYFLEVDGFDPRIHTVFFCPQLYKYDADQKLVPLYDDEIGQLIAHALEHGIKDRRPWYHPLDSVPSEPVITTLLESEFDTLLVEMPPSRTSMTPRSTNGAGIAAAG
jgi:hypothetical protein